MSAVDTNEKKEKDLHAIERVLAGDGEVYRILIKRYQAEAMQYAFLMCGEEEQAQKLVGEGFRHAFKALEHIDRRGYFLPVLLQSLREVLFQAPLSTPAPSLSVREAQTLLDRIKKQMNTQDLRPIVVDVLFMLPPAMREMWVLRFVLQLDDRDIQYVTDLMSVKQVHDRQEQTLHRIQETAQKVADEEVQSQSVPERSHAASPRDDMGDPNDVAGPEGTKDETPEAKEGKKEKAEETTEKKVNEATDTPEELLDQLPEDDRVVDEAETPEDHKLDGQKGEAGPPEEPKEPEEKPKKGDEDTSATMSDTGSYEGERNDTADQPPEADHKLPPTAKQEQETQKPAARDETPSEGETAPADPNTREALTSEFTPSEKRPSKQQPAPSKEAGPEREASLPEPLAPVGESDTPDAPTSKEQEEKDTPEAAAAPVRDPLPTAEGADEEELPQQEEPEEEEAPKGEDVDTDDDDEADDDLAPPGLLDG